MSVAHLVLPIFISFIITTTCQYVRYSPSYSYQRYYQQDYQPCQSLCQPVNYCQNLPCYNQQQYYYPYQYQYPYPYRAVGQNFRPSGSSDPYANVPVEIIDEDSLSLGHGSTILPSSTNKDPYANVPVEIIDQDRFQQFFKNLPKLPKTLKQSSSSNYTVSQGAATSHSTLETKPVSATINRVFPPVQRSDPIMLDFMNGQPVNQESQTTVTEVTSTETTTVIVTTTTEESEDVEGVNKWF